MTPSTRLYLIRHGEVEAAYQKVFGGRIDMALSETGLAQANSVAEVVGPVELNALYASPMRRARQTVAAVEAKLNRAAVFMEGLREVDFGCWTGLRWEEVKERHAISAFDWLVHLEGGTIADAEPEREFRARVKNSLDEIIARHEGQRVAIVCHGGVIRMILALLLTLPLQATAAFDIDYGSVSIVDQAPSRTEIRLLNFTPWRSQL